MGVIHPLTEQKTGEFVNLLIIPEPTRKTMDTKSTTDILKEAILLEHRGRAFYSDVAARTDSEAVKRIFTMIAEEEVEHIRFLSAQFKNYQEHNTLDRKSVV